MARDRIEEDVRALRAAIAEHGLLLEHDAVLPSATRLIAGEPVRGSWWAHPAGGRVYHALGALDAHEVLATRLVAGKITLVHRALFPQLLAIATEDAPWQTAGLARDARALLERVRSGGATRTDREPPIPRATKKIGALAVELEKRLLVVSREEHTEHGAHAKVLEMWPAWARRERVRAAASAPCARAELEARVARWGAEPSGLLPWAPRSTAKKGRSRG